MAKKKPKPDAAKRREELRKQLEEQMQRMHATPARIGSSKGSSRI
jgi:hypothetical protein